MYHRGKKLESRKQKTAVGYAISAQLPLCLCALVRSWEQQKSYLCVHKLAYLPQRQDKTDQTELLGFRTPQVG